MAEPNHRKYDDLFGVFQRMGQFPYQLKHRNTEEHRHINLKNELSIIEADKKLELQESETRASFEQVIQAISLLNYERNKTHADLLQPMCNFLATKTGVINSAILERVLLQNEQSKDVQTSAVDSNAVMEHIGNVSRLRQEIATNGIEFTKLREQANRQQIRIAELESELKLAVQEAKAKTEDLQQLERTNKDIRASESNLRSKVDGLRTARGLQEREVRSLSGKNTKLKEDLRSSKERCERLLVVRPEMQRIDELELRVLTAESGTYWKFSEISREQLNSAHSQNEKLKSSYQRLERGLLVLVVFAQHTLGTVETITQLLSDTKDELEEVTQHLSDTKGEVEEVTQRLSDTKGEVEEVTQLLNDTKGEVEEVTQLLNDTKGEVEEGIQLLNDTKGEVEEVTQLLNDTKGEVEVVTQLLNDTKGEVEEVTQLLNDTKGEVEEVTQLLNDTKGEVEEVRSANHELQQLHFTNGEQAQQILRLKEEMYAVNEFEQNYTVQTLRRQLSSSQRSVESLQDELWRRKLPCDTMESLETQVAEQKTAIENAESNITRLDERLGSQSDTNSALRSDIVRLSGGMDVYRHSVNHLSRRLREYKRYNQSLLRSEAAARKSRDAYVSFVAETVAELGPVLKAHIAKSDTTSFTDHIRAIVRWAESSLEWVEMVNRTSHEIYSELVKLNAVGLYDTPLLGSAYDVMHRVEEGLYNMQKQHETDQELLQSADTRNEEMIRGLQELGDDAAISNDRLQLADERIEHLQEELDNTRIFYHRCWATKDSAIDMLNAFATTLKQQVEASTYYFQTALAMEHMCHPEDRSATIRILLWRNHETLVAVSDDESSKPGWMDGYDPALITNTTPENSI